MADITNQLRLASNTPDEAAKNIDDARTLKVDTDAYIEHKPYMQSEADLLKLNTNVTKGVAQFSSLSSQHASLIKNDTFKLSQAETLFTSAIERVKGEGLETKITQLKAKRDSDPTNFTVEERADLFVSEEEFNTRKSFKTNEPNPYEETINKYLESKKDRNVFKSVFDGLAGGFASQVAGAAQIPTAIYSLYYLPANLLRRFRGEPEIIPPESLTKNPVYQDFMEMANTFNTMTPQMTKDVSESVRAGNWEEAGEILAVKMANGLPNLASTIAANFLGGPVTAMVTAGGLTTTQSNIENLNKGISPSGSIINAVTKGTIEGTMERFVGTIATLNRLESALTFSFGKDSASKVMFNMTKSLFGSTMSEATEEGLTSIAQDVTDIVSGINPNALEGMAQRALEAAIVGGALGGAVVAPAAAAKARSNIYYYNQRKSIESQSINILEFDGEFRKGLKLIDETTMGKNSEAQTQEFQEKLYKGSGLKKLYIMMSTLGERLKTPEAAEAVLTLIGDEGKLATKLNAPVAIEPHKWFAIEKQFPEVKGEYKLSPESLSVNQAQEFLDDAATENDKRIQILEILGKPDATPEDFQLMRDALNIEQPSGVYPSNDVYGEAEYMDTASLEASMKGIVPDAEAKKIVEDHVKAKQEIVDNINDTAEYEMNQVLDIQMIEVMDAEKQSQLNRLENNPAVNTVERFANHTELPNDAVLQSVEGLETAHVKKGYSPLAIDPSTLPDHLKSLVKDPRIKKNKVFVKGGMNVNDTAAILGYESADALLAVLAQTPSREEIAEQRTQAREAELLLDNKNAVGLNEVGITKAYEARVTNALNMMTVMKDKFWASTKKIIKRAAITPPTSRELMSQARTTVMKTKVGDLNVNQFKVGERRSERIAMDSVLKGQFEKAMINQRAVATNIALTAQTQLMTGKINRILRQIRKFNTPSVVQELKDAGPLYIEAVQELLSRFNFSNKDNTVERDSFKRWAEKVAKEGYGDFTIPDRMWDQRQSFNDMTVEQVLAVGETLQGILHTAKMKNRLFKKREKITTLQTIENIGNKIQEQLSKDEFYDPKLAKTLQDSPNGPTQRVAEQILGMSAYLERLQHILVKLDQGKDVGLFNDLFWRPLVDASNAKKFLIKETQGQLNKLIDEFGRQEFQNLSNEIVYIPEFVNFQSFESQNFSKSQLLSMELNFGNEGNLVELEKLGGYDENGKPLVGRDVIRKVLDRELTDKHTVFVQNIWNMYESFRPKMEDLQRRTKGVDTEWVQAKPFVARGKEIPGGYYPIARLSDRLKVEARKAEGVGSLHTLENFALKYYGEGMTEQGHLKSRTGNDDIMELNLNVLGYSLNQMIHDLTHREVIADGVKLLSDKKIREEIAKVVGKDGYANITNTYIAVAQEVENDSYGDNPFLKFMNNYLGGGMQIVALGGNVTSALIQPASVIVALDRMGADSTGVFYKTATNMLNNPSLIFSFYELAEKINPAISSFTEDVYKNSSSTINDMMPTKDSTISPLLKGREFISEASFRMLSEVDKMNKVLVTLTAYQMAIQGKVKGLENLKDDVEGAMKYASNISELTQTHNDVRNMSPIQRNKYMKQFTYFFNDLNNLYNNSLARSREIRRQYKKGNHWQGLLQTGSFLMVLSILKLFEKFMRGEELPGDNPEKNTVKEWVHFMISEPIKTLVGTVPFGGSINYALDAKWEKGFKNINVTIPLTSTLTDLTVAFSGLYNYMEFWDENYTFTKAERRALWRSAGIITHLPTGVIYNQFVREKRDSEYLKPSMLNRMSQIAGRMVNNPEVSAQFKQSLSKLEAQLNPPKVVIPEGTYSVLKEAISNSNPTMYNENTGAAGIYQFTEETWNKIMKDAPELGLTENGRVSQKTEQQQKAFEYTAKVNGEILRSTGFQANTETLYASHILGAFKTVQILSADDSTKVGTMLNASIKKQYGIGEEMSVKEFKDWLIIQTVKAERRLTK